MSRDFPFRLIGQARKWLAERTAEPVEHTNPDKAFALLAPRGRTIPLLAIGASVFFFAIGIRLLYWQDRGVYVYDRAEIQRILEGTETFFPSSAPEAGDATMVVHPPGYPLLMQGIFKIFDGSDSSIALVQVIADSLAVVMVLLISGELLPLTVAVISAVLVALSPHLTYYSLHLSPESLSVLPILLAVYFLIRAIKRPRHVSFIAVGACIGLSCWLRANGMLLAPFISIGMILLFTRGKRIIHAGIIVVAAALVIAPITIRNWTVYHHFIPLSIGAGVTLITGIADYDTEGRFGFPKLDWDVQKQEAEMYGRPEYARNLEDPDGIERDRARFVRGLAVVRSNPIWFGHVMLRRAGFMVRYNDSSPHDWPFTTAIVPIISAEPTPRRSLQITDNMEPVWINSPYDFASRGKIISPDAKVSIDDANQSLYIAGDGSEYGDQILSENITVQKNTDHVLAISLKVIQGEVAVKVMSIDNRVTLASANINSFVEKSAILERRRKKKGGILSGEADATDQQIQVIQLPFGSGNRTGVCIAFSNNGASPQPPELSISEARIFAVGATPYLWTYYPRLLIRSIQKRIFTTPAMLSLIVAGIVFLAVAGGLRALSILLIVPVYYLSVQSALHTEYRYVLVIHYFLFIIFAFSIYCIANLVTKGLRLTVSKVIPENTGVGSKEARDAVEAIQREL
jgi:hypothetical protein